MEELQTSLAAAQQAKDDASSSLAAASVRVGQLQHETADGNGGRGCELKPVGRTDFLQGQGCSVNKVTDLKRRVNEGLYVAD